MDDDRPAVCEGCGANRATIWCYVWNTWLCAHCRWLKTEATLKPTGLIHWHEWERRAS